LEGKRAGNRRATEFSRLLRRSRRERESELSTCKGKRELLKKRALRKISRSKALIIRSTHLGLFQQEQAGRNPPCAMIFWDKMQVQRGMASGKKKDQQSEVRLYGGKRLTDGKTGPVTGFLTREAGTRRKKGNYLARTSRKRKRCEYAGNYELGDSTLAPWKQKSSLSRGAKGNYKAKKDPRLSCQFQGANSRQAQSHLKEGKGGKGSTFLEKTVERVRFRSTRGGFLPPGKKLQQGGKKGLLETGWGS